MDEFKHYYNPTRARRVWGTYEEDFTRSNIMRAWMLLQNCQTADDLDIKLDILVGKPVHIAGNVRPSLNDIDEDSNGGYSNARRALEEGR